jgi:hypothetical protein
VITLLINGLLVGSDTTGFLILDLCIDEKAEMNDDSLISGLRGSRFSVSFIKKKDRSI